MGQIVDLLERIRIKVNTSHARRRSFHKEPTRAIIQHNANVLWNQVDDRGGRKWSQGMPQGKTVYNVTKTMGESGPTLETLELLVSKAKIPVWYLFLPLDARDLFSQDLATLVYTFLELGPESRTAILASIRAFEAALK